MKIKFSTTEKIPTWALCYIINGDSSGLEDGEIEMVDKFCGDFPGAVYSPKVNENYDMEPYFTSRPAFGLPCEVVDTEIVLFES